MIPAIDVPQELSNCKLSSTSENLIKRELQEGEMFALNAKNYGHELTTISGITCGIGSDSSDQATNCLGWLKLIEKSVIIHKDENGFGLRIKGQSPVFVEHVHENGAAWRAGVRQSDRLSKVNGIPVSNMDHKEVVLIFKSCTRFVGLTLLTCQEIDACDNRCLLSTSTRHSRQASSCGRSSLAGSMRLVLENPANCDDNEQASTDSWRCSLDYSPFDLKLLSNSNYENNIWDAVNEKYLTVAKSVAHRSQSSQSFNLNQHHSRQLPVPILNGDTNHLAPRSPSLSARQASPINIGARQADIACATARRSESVSVALSKNLGRQQNRFLIPSNLNELRISVSQNDAHQVGQLQQQQQQPQPKPQPPTCIDCSRKQIESHSAVDSKSMKSVGDKLNTCCECQKLASLFHQQQQQQQQLRRQKRSQINSAGLEESLQFEQPTRDMETLKKLTCALPNSKLQANYKLTQSGSLDGISRKTSATIGQTSNGSFAHTGVNRTREQTPVVVNKRIEIIREFIDTEKTHTDRLRCLDKLFYRPLKAGNYMTSEQLRMVFSCHRTLYKIHRQIYRTLSSANYNLFSEPLIGSALREIFESDLKRRLERASCSFCAAQSTNTELLNKLTRRDTKVGDFLAQVTSQQMIGRLGIKDLLASCFQRLTKYPLLLENLLKATPQPPVINRKRCRRTGNGKEASEEPNGRIFNLVGEGLNEEEEEDDDDEEEDEEEVRNSRRMLAISLAEEREFIERALQQSRQILVKVNESVKVAMSRNKLKEIWKRTDKYPGVPLIDITNQQMVHDGLLTLRLSKRSFDVYVLLLNDYIIILTREGQDKYRLKFFTPEGKSSALTSSSSASSQTVYSPVFVIDEHLATRDAATDENGFYLLCKRKDDSRIYEFASRSPAERMNWRDKIQWTIDRQIGIANRRPSCESTLTKSSSEISARQDMDDLSSGGLPATLEGNTNNQLAVPPNSSGLQSIGRNPEEAETSAASKALTSGNRNDEPTKIEGTISYVEDDGIVMPSKMESSRALVEQAVQVNMVDSACNATQQTGSMCDNR